MAQGETPVPKTLVERVACSYAQSPEGPKLERDWQR